MTILAYPSYPDEDPIKKEKVTNMTMVPSPAKRGNGKTLKEIEQRHEKSLARIEFEKRTKEARAAAEQLTRISDLKIAQRENVLNLHEKQEAARAPQFQIDQRLTLFILLALTVLTFIATAVLSADGTIGASSAARYAVPWFGYLLFGALEVAVLAFMLMYYVLGSRVDYNGNRVKSGQWFFAMIVAAVAAVSLSVYHVLDLYHYDWTSVGMWVGIGIRLVTTVFFLVVSKGVASVIFAKAIQL